MMDFTPNSQKAYKRGLKSLSSEEWAIIIQICIIIANIVVIPLILLIMYFVCPPVSYDNYYQDKPPIEQAK